MTDYTHDFMIGTDISHMVNLFDLSTRVPYPKTAPMPYAGTVDLDDLNQRGVGFPTVTWLWSVLDQPCRDILRTYCTVASAPVVIRTRTNENAGEFLYYTATMVWPSLSEEYDARKRLSFSILFRRMILTSPPA